MKQVFTSFFAPNNFDRLSGKNLKCSIRDFLFQSVPGFLNVCFMRFPTELRRRKKGKNKSYVERDVVLSENVYMMHPYTS